MLFYLYSIRTEFHLSSLSLLFSDFDVLSVTLELETVIELETLKQQVPLI